MKTKMISILTVMVLMINMIMPIGSVLATGASATVTFTANKTSLNPGDEVEYTITATTVGTAILDFSLSIPSGLTYVANSATVGSNVGTLSEKSVTEDTQGVLYTFAHENPFDFNNVVIGTFKCTVDNTASGSLTVTAKDFELADENYTDISNQGIINSVSVTVAKNATSISLNKNKTTIEKEKTEKLIATVEPGDATDKTVEWVTSDSSVATVEKDGTVVAKNKGTATITAKTVNNHTADCVVTVVNPVQSIFIMKNDSVCKAETIDKDEEITLTAEVNPSDADDKTVTWTSSEPNVASVSNGVVKGLSKGSSTITAKTSNGKEATCLITVGISLKSITLKETEKTIKNGENYTFSVIYNPEDTDADKKINWSSSNSEVATVDDNGKVTVHKCTGTATITATVNSDNTKTASAIVTANHKDDKLTLHEAKEATCSAEGNKAYYTCSGCQDWYEDETGSTKITDKESVKIAINSTAHDWGEGITTKEPTCTEAGEKTYRCKTNREHTKTEPISAKGHKMTKTEAKAETCEKNGNIDYYTCSECKKIFKDETGNVEITQEQTVVKAKGHKWGEWTETTPATTETEGEETRTCENDSKHIETRSIPKLHKHDLSKTEAKAATCIAEGNKEYWKCSICNKTFSDSEGTKELEDVVIPVDNEAHDWNEWQTTKEPTCTEKGSKTRTCKLDNTHTETEEINMVAHILTKVDEVKATCEKEGNKEYYKCSVCDKYFEDSTATTEITDKSSVITSELGHNYDEGTVTKEATCTVNGVKTYTCKNDSSHTRTEVIPAAHKLTKIEAKVATCVAEGNIEYWECSVCNKKFSNESATTEVADVVLPIDSEAHDWNEWQTTKEATVDEEGLKTRTCKLESTHIETEKIDRIPYAIEEGNGQTHYYEEKKGIEIKTNGTLEKLVRLLVDNKIELTENDVDLKSGSTIATLRPAFLDSLSEGQHTLTFEYTDGSVDAIFNVAKTPVEVPEEEKTGDTTDNSIAEQEKTNTTTTTKNSLSPKTGDNIVIWISLLAISIVGIFIATKFTIKLNK